MPILPDFDAMYRDMAASSPQMKRGDVWCEVCGQTLKVDSAKCLRHGWPLCCERTMSLGKPNRKK